MNLRIVLFLVLVAPLAASGGASCDSPKSESAAKPPPAAVTNDVDGNGIEDAYDIATGSLSDEDLDGIPDEAEALAWDPEEEGPPRS
ncbi:MAG: hypothetical protein VX460_10600 [Planctomycetota bacterium]|nr:hypothetical protein [Planctomycetota bacterium]